MRRILSLEALEDRTLLSGNVIATLDATTGILSISGDAGNNSITISQQPGNVLQVAGTPVKGPPPDVTTVNGVKYTNFASTSVTAINIKMLDGNDTVVMNGASIPGNLTITAGKGKDTFSTTGISANTITIQNTAGPGSDSVTMNNTNAGKVTMNLGTSGDTVSMDNGNNGKGGLKIGTLSINTGSGTATDSVSITNFANVGSVPGIGKLAVAIGNGNNNKINVTNATLTTASLASGNGNNGTITFASPKVLSTTSITAGTGTNTITVSGTLNALSVTTGGGGSVTFDKSTASSANITVGKGPATVDTSNDNITGAAGLTVNVGAAGNTALDEVMANNDMVAGNMTVNVLDDGPQYWSTLPEPNGTVLPSSNLSVNNDKVTGSVTVSTGNFFRTVTVGATVGGSLKATIGNGGPSNSEAVQFNTNVSGNENIKVGNFYSSNPPIPLLMPSKFSLSGSAGSLYLNVGDNAAGGVSQNAAVTGSETVIIGANAGAVTVMGPSKGDNSVTVGANAGAVAVKRPTNGNSTVTVGDNSGGVTVAGNDDALDSALTETITVGNNVSGPVTIQGNLSASEGGSWTENITAGDNDTINANANVTGNEYITSKTGNNDNVSVSSVNVSGALVIKLPGSGDSVTVDPSTVGSLTITTGNNATISVSDTTATSGDVDVSAGNGASIALNKVMTDNGNVNVTAGDNATGINVSNTTATGGDVNVKAGNGAALIHLESITDDNGSVNVSAGDNTTEIDVVNSTASTMNISNGDGNDTGSPFIYLSGDEVGEGNAGPGGGLNLNTGNGNNTVEMLNVEVLDGLMATLGSGINTFFAQNVLSDFGTVNGGSGGSNVYYDMGGNFGYDLEGFAGYFVM